MSDVSSWGYDRAAEEFYKKEIQEALGMGISPKVWVELKKMKNHVAIHKNTLPYGFVVELEARLNLIIETLEEGL